jgi:very-short-patch-repair endonuclease
MRDIPTIALEIVERQHGVITRAQLRGCGLTHDVIDRRLARGHLVALHMGVFCFRGSPDSFLRRVFAALLAAGSDAAASYRSAAALAGLGPEPTTVEISVPRSQRPRLRGVTVYRVSRLTIRHVFDFDGIRMTTIPRTLCDLASIVTADELELTLDEALKRRKTTRAYVVAALDALPRNARGAGTLRALLAARPEGKARMESPLEQTLHRLLAAAQLPDFHPQHVVAGCRIDAAFPQKRLAVQVDSYLHHSSRTDWAKDHRRNKALVEAGWRVLPVTKEDLDRGPELVSRIQKALTVG